MPDGEEARFEALLKLNGLKKEGWTKPFRKDMVGQKKLFGLLAAMLLHPDALRCDDLLSGMEAKQREAFAAMAADYMRPMRGRTRRPRRSLTLILPRLRSAASCGSWAGWRWYARC